MENLGKVPSFMVEFHAEVVKETAASVVDRNKLEEWKSLAMLSNKGSFRLRERVCKVRQRSVNWLWSFGKSR